jgi:WD40 repeat protein/serine/threonine protein kinase
MKVRPGDLGRSARCPSCGVQVELTVGNLDADADAAIDAAASGRPVGQDGAPVDWQPGDKILGLYHVESLLGRGGFGKVYKVGHQAWKLYLAVKSPRAELVSNPKRVANFERECETWINLGLHPNIVTCYYVRRIGDVPRVFAEYVEGGALSDMIVDGTLYHGSKETVVGRILDIAIQFAWGLGYAHTHSLVHHDVKPHNVLVQREQPKQSTEDEPSESEPTYRVKVTDFGLSRAWSEEDGSQRGRNYFEGTVLYCSPEQAACQRLTNRSDLWSWALSVLEMFVGGPTWMTGAAGVDLLDGYLELGPENLHIPLMPMPLVDLLRACFHPNPEARPATMETAAEPLKSIYEEVTGHPYPRPHPTVAGDSADTLNNRAVSMLDLGKSEEALALWEQALTLDSKHAESVYNRGLYLWRRGQFHDIHIIGKIRDLAKARPDDWLPKYLFCQVQIERGEYAAAHTGIKHTQKEHGNRQELVNSELRAQKLHGKSRRFVRAFEGHAAPVTSLFLSWDGDYALSGSQDHSVRMWELKTGDCVRTFEGHADAITSASLSADGRYVLSSSLDGTLRLWDMMTGTTSRKITEAPNPILSAAFSPDSTRIVAGLGDGHIKLYDVQNGACVGAMKEHRGAVEGVHISEYGNTALSGSRDGLLILWDLKRHKGKRAFQGHKGKVLSVFLKRDGKLALSGSTDHTARLWDVATGECLKVFQGHKGAIGAVSLSRGGQHALTSSADKSLKLWELRTGRCLYTFEGTGPVSISGDDHIGLSGSADNSVRLYELNLDVPLQAANMLLCHAVTE